MAVYDSFFEFRAAPFALNPDPGFLFLSRQHREALAGLVYAVRDRKGFAVLTGEVGTGKTTLVHALLSTLGDEVETALVFNPHLSRRDLYRHLLAEFRLPPEGSTLACVRALQKMLLAQFAAGVRVVVIIDEAHALSDDILEEVRLLSNFETSQSKLMQVLLVGQPELAQRLQDPALRQLRQRIALRCELQPLGFGELIDYVRSRLATVGGNPDLFSPRACVTLYRFSGGLPRLINTLCDHALLSGFARDQRTIGPRLVRRAARALDLPPVARVGWWPWLRSRRQAVVNSGEVLKAAGISSLVEAGR